MSSQEKKIPLGKLGRTKGLRGEIYFYPSDEDSDLPNINQTIYVKCGPAELPLTVNKHHIKNSKKRILKFEEFNQIEEVKPLVNSKVSLPRSEFPKLPEGEFYLFDLEGFSIFDCNKNNRGEIKSFYNNGAHDIAVIKSSDEEFPFVTELIIEIDKQKQEIYLDFE